MNRDADKLRYLETLYDYQQANEGLIPHLPELFGDDITGSDTYWRGIVKSLVDAGLVNDASGGGGLDGISAWLTPEGEEWVEDFRERGSNPTLRRKAAPTLLLGWIDTHDQGGPSWMQIFPAFDTIRFMAGPPLSRMEIQAAAERLVDDGLIETDDNVWQVHIKADGQRCAESGLEVDEWLQQNRKVQQGVTHNWNIQGISGSNVAMGSHDFQQTVTNHAASADEVKVLLAAILEAAEVTGVPAETAAVVAEQVSVVRAEVDKPDANPAILRPAFAKIVDGLATGTQGALSVVLPGLVQVWLIQHGYLLPPQT